MNKYSAKISPKDLFLITRKYGNNIEDIYELGPGQMWMFGEKKNNKSAFFLQMTFTVQMELDPAEFKEKVNRECRRRDTLRFAYVYRGLDRPYCVSLKNRRAEINFEDISGISPEDVDRSIEVASKADRRRGFDLENDSLLRIQVYKVSRDNRFVFIVSQPHINSDGTSIGILIKDIFIDYALKIETPLPDTSSGDYKSIAEYENSVDKKSELLYWKNYLKDSTEDIALPGKVSSDKEFIETVYVSNLPEDVDKALSEGEKKYKTTTFNILQAAWGIMLNRLTGRKDVIFGAITSGREVAMFKSMTIPGGFVKVIPVRMKIDDDMKVTEVFSLLQKEFISSMSNSHVSIDQIKETIGRKAPLFDHVLNCHNFAGNKAFSSSSKEIPGMKILDINIYDNLSEDLAVYIRNAEAGTQLAIGYNASAFSGETVELYAETFRKVLRQVLFCDESTLIGQLETYDKMQFEYVANLRQCEELKKTMLLKKHRLFAFTKWDLLESVAEHSTIATYLEGDRIYEEKSDIDYLPILISGQVVIKATAGHGWVNPIKVCKDGAVLTYSALFKDGKTESAAEVRSESAIVLKVSYNAVRKLFEMNPRLIYIVTEDLYRECIKYEKLWLGA